MIVKNPYIFKINGKLIMMSFSDTEKTAEDGLTSVLEIHIVEVKLNYEK